MRKYVIPQACQYIVLCERGFLTSMGKWTSNMDDAGYFQSVQAVQLKLEKIGENHTITWVQE